MPCYSVPIRCRAAAWPICVFVGLLLGACNRQEEIHVEKAPLAPSERFDVELPPGFEAVQLRGEGSERMRAPSGVRVERTAFGFHLEAGPEFAVDVAPNAAPLSEFAAPSGVSRVFSESDLAVFKSPAGAYSFIVVRDLVPEWDETERQRFACGSAGGGVSGAARRADSGGFSKAAVQNMVAACRTLELPALE